VGVANVAIAGIAVSLPAIHGGHEAWRYTLISGVIPAIPLILIRPFLPESPVWAQKKAAGKLRRPSIAELFSPQLRRATLTTTLIFAASYGLAFGAIQQLPQILGAQAVGTPAERGHPQMIAAAKAAVGAAVAEAKADGKPDLTPVQKKQIGANANDKAVAGVTIWQETGGLVGRFALAVLAVRVLSRRTLLRIFQIPAMIIVPLLFWWISTSLTQPDSLPLIRIGIFVAGFFVVAQFSFWGNYIPLVFPVHLRGTGESFAANIGGRIIGTAAAWFTITLSQSTPPSQAKMALMAAVVAGTYAVIGVLLTKWLPEPKADANED
jgi:hypothetical protein